MKKVKNKLYSLVGRLVIRKAKKELIKKVDQKLTRGGKKPKS
jgi:chaperonin cofactor prefoldin